jgi:hypothetical protein
MVRREVCSVIRILGVEGVAQVKKLSLDHFKCRGTRVISRQQVWILCSPSDNSSIDVDKLWPVRPNTPSVDKNVCRIHTFPRKDTQTTPTYMARQLDISLGSAHGNVPHHVDHRQAYADWVRKNLEDHPRASHMGLSCFWHIIRRSRSAVSVVHCYRWCNGLITWQTKQENSNHDKRTPIVSLQQRHSNQRHQHRRSQQMSFGNIEIFRHLDFIARSDNVTAKRYFGTLKRLQQPNTVELFPQVHLLNDCFVIVVTFRDSCPRPLFVQDGTVHTRHFHSCQT